MFVSCMNLDKSQSPHRSTQSLISHFIITYFELSDVAVTCFMSGPNFLLSLFHCSLSHFSTQTSPPFTKCENFFADFDFFKAFFAQT